jgi:hypothetical protein
VAREAPDGGGGAGAAVALFSFLCLYDGDWCVCVWIIVEKRV